MFVFIYHFGSNILLRHIDHIRVKNGSSRLSTMSRTIDLVGLLLWVFIDRLPGSGQDWKYFIQGKSDHIFYILLFLVGWSSSSVGCWVSYRWNGYFMEGIFLPEKGPSGAVGIFRWIRFLPGWVSVGRICWSHWWNWHYMSVYLSIYLSIYLPLPPLELPALYLQGTELLV